ncbi:MAG: hypothetical protein JNM24_13875 [Bdellovibrionaceae bacterium]|nr:hypothetical protein [Pseudobdellovibrionaceae bacterium]
MKRISICLAIIMIHSGYSVFAASSVDFNKEIEMVMNDQFNTHVETMAKTRVTEAAVDFENTYRKPSPSKNLTFFPLKLRAKPKPKTKVAESVAPVPGVETRANLIQLYREQVL